MAKRHWQKVSSKVVYENKPFFWVTEDAVIRPDGKPGTYGVVHSNGAVFVVAVTKLNKLVLIAQDRYPVGRETIELVAGGLGENADVLRQAEMELHEEINASAEKFELLATFLSSPSRQVNNHYVVLATGIDDALVNTRNQESDEAINAVYLWESSEVAQKIVDGKINDSATIACISVYWAKYGFPRL